MTKHGLNRRLFSPRPRGSVLVFALVLLMLLLGVGVAFFLSVRQSATASANAMRSGTTDAALRSGEAHATRLIRDSVLNFNILSPDGIFVPVGVTRPYLLEDPLAPVSFPQRNLFRVFEAYPSDLSAADTIAHKTSSTPPQKHAWLWWHEDNTFCKTYDLETDADPALRFTEGYLTHDANIDGSAATYYSGGPQHAGLARQFLVAGNAEDLYVGMNKTLQVTSTRGEYYVWIVDLDAKLNVYPQIAPNGWELTDQANFSAWTTKPVTKDTAQGIFDKLGTDTGNNIDFGTALVFDKIWTLPSTGHHSTGDFFTHLDRDLSALTEEQQLRSRYGLDRMFSVLNGNELPLAEANALKVPQSIKPHRTALNINTAAPETIAAALSRIPLVENYDPATPTSQTDNDTKATWLARRICAKRPFLSQIDFEDFLAAHLNTYPITGVDDPITGTGTPVWMIKTALPKRQPLSLVAYMGLDDVQIGGTALDDTQLLARNPQLNAVDPIQSASSMEARFDFFRADDAQAPLHTDNTNNALISVQAFNNILNSVSGKRRDGSYGSSYYSYGWKQEARGTAAGAGEIQWTTLLDAPFRYVLDNAGTYYDLIPKFEYERILTAGGQYALTGTGEGSLVAWHATNAFGKPGFYDMVFFANDDIQQTAVGQPAPTAPSATIIVDPGLNGTLETPATGDDVVSGPQIIDGGGAPEIADTSIDGPLRAYRHSLDDPATAPTATPTDGPNTDGDVAWSPRVCFRSRFFKIYVLARGIRALDKDGNYLYSSTRRSEIVYDALTDRVLWRREPATEKHALGDPSVPAP